MGRGRKAGGAAGSAGRSGRKAAAHGGERGDKVHRTPHQHAAGRKGTDVKSGPNGLSATGPTPAERRKARREKITAEARGIRERKAARAKAKAAKAKTKTKATKARRKPK